MIAFSSVLLVEGDRRVVFDSAHVGRRTLLLAALERRGLTPRDIDAHVVSHAHWDHVQNIDLFRQAPVLMHPDEIRYAHHPHVNDWATPQWTGAMLDTMEIPWRAFPADDTEIDPTLAWARGVMEEKRRSCNQICSMWAR